MESVSFGAVVVSFLHQLFAVVWLGNLLLTYFSIAPAARDAFGPEAKKFMTAYQKRQSRFGMASMLGLVLTGMVLAKQSPEFAHLFSTANTFSAILTMKHLMVIASFGLALVSAQVLGKGKPSAGKERLSQRFLQINVVLVFLILFASAWLNAAS